MGKSVAGALAENDAEIEGTLHDDRVGEREGKEGEQDRHREKSPGRGHLQVRFSGKRRGHQQHEHWAEPEQRTCGHHSQAPEGIRCGSRNGEEPAHDGGNEDTERQRGEDISRDLKRTDCGKVGLDEPYVVKPAIGQCELGGDDRDLGNDDEPLDPRVADVGTGADGKIDAEQDERDEHPLDGEDFPEDGEGCKEAGKISRSAAEDGHDVHDAQQEPGIPFQRPGQDHPIAEQQAEGGKEGHQHDVSQPAGEGGRNTPLRHQAHFRRVHPTQSIAINDGKDLSWTSVEGLADEPCHSGKRDSIHGNGLVLGCHPRAS